MLKFLEGDNINARILQCIREADKYLTLISPYIKLSEKVKAELKHLSNTKPEVTIEIIFGKNDGAVVKSLSKDDFEFIKELPNVNLSYSPNLHAKIYCSEDCIIVGSMNLHVFSQANNFEAAFIIERKTWLGTLLQGAMIQSLAQTWDDTLDFVEKIVSTAKPVYRKGPKYEPFLFGLLEKIVGEEDAEDNSGSFYMAEEAKPKSWNKPATGHCIRTGKPIPFDIKRPFSDEAYRSWSRFSNKDYAERYCHFSGEESKGDTTYNNPVLRKNWKQAKQKFGF